MTDNNNKNKKNIKASIEDLSQAIKDAIGENLDTLKLVDMEVTKITPENAGITHGDEEENEKDKETDDGSIVLPMIPLRGVSVFPSTILHFDIGREKSVKALEKSMLLNQQVFLVTQKDESTALPTEYDFYEMGTIAKVKQMLRLPGDSIRVLVEGVKRGTIAETLFQVPYFKCRINVIEEYDVEITPHVEALMRTVTSEFNDYYSDIGGGKDLVSILGGIEQPGRLADSLAANMNIKTLDKQSVLEIIDPVKRLEHLGSILSRELEIQTIEADIDMRVKTQMGKSQKEYYLKEQMRAIQEELGFDEDSEDEIATWREKIKTLGMPEKIEKKVEKEINKFSRLQPSSAESNVSRTYIETILDLPWNKLTESEMDLNNSKKILDDDHYGLEKVKERVLEYLAVVQLSGELKGPILCLVGPPGVGKTSVARSVARAINRDFVRMSLGGVRDEAEIRGHRRTYIGAIPGRIISLIKEAGTMNPVLLFDEVDKIGNDFKGDPASALLEVLDPEQNKEFVDHYLEIPFDLSKVMFITTANTTSTIPRPLLDRMEVINVTGYTEGEKVEIAKRHLVVKQIEAHGLKTEQIKISDNAIRDIINYYTRESGVRNLERELANVCRKVALKLVTKNKENYSVNPKNLSGYLGKKKYFYDIIEKQQEVGVTTGLAWTIVGGDTLFIETTAVPGTGKLVLTGQLGEVMQESAKAGISYIRSIAHDLGIEEDFYKTKDLHIHIPEGATPKDGPSAGVTMCTAIISTLAGIPARKDIAMTGEITLRGKVLPVGGIREKVLAAHRAGIRKVLLPRENERDIDDIPSNVKKKIEFVFLDTVQDALKEVLVK
ncbi:MAG: endopeptidase La [Eubacteriales bacterium]|nr:endopeptidase La [Eubacteriales bacterium]MDD4390984.1 endopeptidase La [Eubacteriales bacterium]